MRARVNVIVSSPLLAITSSFIPDIYFMIVDNVIRIYVSTCGYITPDNSHDRQVMSDNSHDRQLS